MKLNREEIRRSVMVLMLFISFASLLAIADRAPLHLEKNCDCIHLRQNVANYVNGIIDQTASGPYVYRILVPYLIIGIHTIFSFISWVDIDFLLKIFLLILCQISFYFFLQNYFSVFVSLSGVFILDILISFTLSSIFGPSVLESMDLLNLLIFILALNSLQKNNFIQFLLLLFLGTVNRETTWFLLPVLFFIDFSKKNRFYRTMIAFIVISVPYFGLRLLIHTHDTSWFTLDKLSQNIPFLSSELTTTALIANFHTAIFLIPLFILSIMNFNKHPEFLRTAAFITPLFIVVHYLLGSIIETRLWLPLTVILIPTSLNTLAFLSNEQSSVQLNNQKTSR